MTAAPHCRCTDMPGTEALKIPLQVGEIPPTGKPDGTGGARPVREISSLSEIGTVVWPTFENVSGQGKVGAENFWTPRCWRSRFPFVDDDGGFAASMPEWSILS